MSDEFVFIAPPSEGKSRTAPAKLSASTPAQQEGQRDLETYLNQMRERLADTVVDSPTHKRLLSDIAAAQEELKGRTPLPKADQDNADQVEFLLPETRDTRESEGRKTITSSLTPRQEQLGAGVAGAYVGSRIKPGMTALFPTREQREAEGLRRIREAFQTQRTYQDILDEQLLRAGIKPEAPATTSGEKWARNWAGQERPGVGGVPEASAAYQRSKGQGKVSGRMTKMWGPAGPNEPTALIDRLMQRSAEAAQQQAQAQRAMQTAGQQAIERVAEARPGPLAQVGRALTGPRAMGALGGLGAGLSAYEAYQRFQEGDRSGAVIAALGGLGGLTSLIPGLGVAGGAVGLASMPAMYINDILKGKIAAPERLPEVDVMGNPVGSYQ